VGAALAGGDNVAIYATFSGVALKEKGETTTTGSQERVAVTTVLVPQVKVLRVVTPQEESGGITGQSTGQNLSGNIAVTLALLPEDAQKFVYSLEQGTVYFGLLPPGEEGTELEPLTVDSILYPPKTKGANE
jgi:dihydroxyacetone kinase